jgi:hypothetical protein
MFISSPSLHLHARFRPQTQISSPPRSPVDFMTDAGRFVESEPLVEISLSLSMFTTHSDLRDSLVGLQSLSIQRCWPILPRLRRPKASTFSG